MTHQEIQLLTIVLALVGAVLALWQLLRTLQTGIARIRYVDVPKATRPRLFRTLVIGYAIAIAVLLGAAASAGALLLSGQY